MSAEGSQSRFRVLMTGDAVGGVWQYSLSLISHLTARGADVLLAILGPEPSVAQRVEAAAIPHLQLDCAPYPLEWMPGAAESFNASSDWLLEQASTFRPDIIHLNGYTHAVLPWGVPVLVVAHSCVASWWRAVHGTEIPAEWSWYRQTVSAGLLQATAIAAPSVAMADALAREHNVPRVAITVINNFTDMPDHPRVDKQPVCLAAGRFWDEAKNLRVLAAVAGRLHWPVLLAGAFEGASENVESASGLELLGALPHTELAARMRRSSIFVHPALYEPFGLAVLEAARARCCLVLADIPSLRELWDGCAQFVDPRDEEHWVLEINRLTADPSERHRLAERALRRSERYRPEPALDAYQQIYAALSARSFASEGTAA